MNMGVIFKLTINGWKVEKKGKMNLILYKTVIEVDTLNNLNLEQVNQQSPHHQHHHQQLNNRYLELKATPSDLNYPFSPPNSNSPLPLPLHPDPVLAP